MSELEELPIELKYMIIKYLDVEDLITLSYVNMEFHNISRDDMLWDNFVKRDYGKVKIKDTWYNTYKCFSIDNPESLIGMIPDKDIGYEYSINFKGETRNYNITDDIKKILWYHKCESESNPCPHCGYGENIYMIAKMIDDMYIFIVLWGGCLTYSSNFADFPIYISDSFNDLYTFCLDTTARKAYEHDRL